MKNFIKIFFIFVYLFISLGANSADAAIKPIEKFASQLVYDEIIISKQISQIESENNEGSVIDATNHPTEINVLRDKKDSFSNSFLDKTNSQNKLLQQIFLSKNNKIYCSISHKISPIFENEICTRAP